MAQRHSPGICARFGRVRASAVAEGDGVRIGQTTRQWRSGCRSFDELFRWFWVEKLDTICAMGDEVA